jgi:lysophospholipase L1-like esterase
MRIVFLGDSLTEGRDGASYLRILRQALAEDASLHEIELVNAGAGGDTALNLIRRVPSDVVRWRPDWVVVLIGVNDATTQLRWRSPMPEAWATRRYFRRVKGLHGPVTPARYVEALRLLVETLRTYGDANVVLCTPATHGEVLTARSWRLLDRYAEAVRLVADERRCALIDLHSTFGEALAHLPTRPWWWRLWGALRAHVAAPMEHEKLARLRGLTYTYDGVHFREAGAALVAGELKRWIETLVGSSTDTNMRTQALTKAHRSHSSG